MPARIVLVGAGVRGVILLDRLRSHLVAGGVGAGAGVGSDAGVGAVAGAVSGAGAVAGADAVEIVVIDPETPGSGRIWRTDQPHPLVMNTLAATTTVFADPASGAWREGDVGGPSVLEWCALVTSGTLPGAGAGSWEAGPRRLREEVRAEAAAMGATDYPSRALFGAYLEWAWEEVLSRMPAGVSVVHHRDTVTDLVDGEVDPGGPGGAVDVELASGATITADAVLLALGWHRPPATQERTPAGLLHVVGDSPIDQGVERIRPGEQVIVRGLGMNFFDLLSLTTEGRGGEYAERDDGMLEYLPSGAEPRIVAGSRRGIPFRAQPAWPDGLRPADLRSTRAALALAPAADVDFAAVLASIGDDADRAWYSALLASDGAPDGDARAALEKLVALLEAAAGDAGSDRAAFDAARARLVALLPETARFDLDRLAAPLPPVTTWAAYERWAREYLLADIAEARVGTRSPLKAGMAVYQSVRPLLSDLAAYGRLTPSSHVGAFLPFLRFAGIAGGVPPLHRVRQLVALMDAGVVRLLGPGLVVEEDASAFRASAPTLSDGRGTGTVLVDARMPSPGVDASTLLRRLETRGAAARHRIGTVETASLAVAAGGNALLDVSGVAHPRVFSIGIPSEDVRVFTIIAPVPGADSAALREADAAARAALTAALPTLSPAPSVP